MKIFVACQKDALNKSCNGTQKKYEMGQALIDAMANKEKVLLIMETHRDGKYCAHDKEGWELIDELQAVIEVLDDEHLANIIAIESPSFACFDIINAIRANLVPDMEVEFIGPLLDKNIFHNIILVYNAFPSIKIKVSKRRCGCSNKIDNEHILEILETLNVEISE